MIKVTNIRPATLNEETHVYTDANGVAARFSVSTIAQRGELKVRTKTLETAAQFGSSIHALMHKIITKNTNASGVACFEDCLKMAQSTALSVEESAVCSKYFDLLLCLRLANPVVSSETSLIADMNGKPVGGTADLIIHDGGTMYIIDFKTAKIEGFKKEYHLQLYGYSLFQPSNDNIKCYTFHPEGQKHLFDSPIPQWITQEFEDNLNYLSNKDKPKLNDGLSEGKRKYLSALMESLEVAREERYALNQQVKIIEAREKEIISRMSDTIEELKLNTGDVWTSDDITIEKNTARRHYLSHCPEIEKYYQCSVSEEYHLTLGSKKVKIKVNNKESEGDNE